LQVTGAGRLRKLTALLTILDDIDRIKIAFPGASDELALA
jgi:hypothetical protein